MALTFTSRQGPAVSVTGGGTDSNTPSVAAYGTTSEWTASGHVLGVGELGLDTTTGDVKAGDGSTVFASLSAVNSATYVQPGGPLRRWQQQIATDPANAKVVFCGDSTSDPTTTAASMFRRLLGLHTQAGEGLHGVGSGDYVTDAVTNGTTTVTSATAAFTSADIGRVVHGRNIIQATTIASVTNATTAVLTNAASGSATGGQFWIGRHIIAGGNNGALLADWMAGPSSGAFRYNRDKLVTDDPDLIVYSWLLNDIRTGGLGITVAACVAAGITRLQTLIDWTRTNLPSADILLRMPNTMLTANALSNNFVTDGATTNPTGQAQIYSTALRRIYNYFKNRYPDVDVIDIQGEVFGAVCASTHPFMLDQLHPNANTVIDVYGITPGGGGYCALADALAARIGVTRNAFVPTGTARVRHEFIVYDGPSANTLRLVSRDPLGIPGTQAPVFATDSLYINGADSPISLTGATVDRTFSSTILQITSLTGDWSPYIGQTATVVGSHAPQTTQDRQQVFVDLASIAAGATVKVTATVTGLATGQTGSGAAVIANPGNGFGASSLVLYGVYPSATNTVTMVINNPTGSAIDLSGESWTFWVVR
jgi:hypothetical protein